MKISLTSHIHSTLNLYQNRNNEKMYAAKHILFSSCVLWLTLTTACNATEAVQDWFLEKVVRHLQTGISTTISVVPIMNVKNSLKPSRLVKTVHKTMNKKTWHQSQRKVIQNSRMHWTPSSRSKLYPAAVYVQCYHATANASLSRIRFCTRPSVTPLKRRYLKQVPRTKTETRNLYQLLSFHVVAKNAQAFLANVPVVTFHCDADEIVWLMRYSVNPLYINKNQKISILHLISCMMFLSITCQMY